MSGVVAHKLSGFSVPKEVLIETGRMATGDSVVRFEEAYGGWQQGRLTQEDAARLLGVCESTLRAIFMTIPEAAGLVLQAGAMGLGGCLRA